MATKLITFRIDHTLNDALEDRCKKLGFSKPGDYFKSLTRYDLLVAKPHAATAVIATASSEEQARLDQRIAQEYFSGTTAGGSFLERLITRVVEEMGATEEPPPSSVAGKLQLMLREPRGSKAA